MSDLATRFSGSLNGVYTNYVAPNFSAAGSTIAEYGTIIANSRTSQVLCSTAKTFFSVAKSNYPSALRFSWSTGTALCTFAGTLIALLILGALLPKNPQS